MRMKTVMTAVLAVFVVGAMAWLHTRRKNKRM